MVLNTRRNSAGNSNCCCDGGQNTSNDYAAKTMQQTAKAYKYCSRTFLTQDERYKCGYNNGYLDAQRDWNSQRWTPSSGGDSSCPRAKGHTFEYCNGYQVGYRTSWNTWLYDYNNGLYPFQGVSDPIHCSIQG
jgi:hypothetical protein